MRAFVTGGTGFLGRRVVRRLVERGDDVVMLVRDPGKAAAWADAQSEAGEQAGRVELVEGNLGDVAAFADQLAGCDVVYHMGARVLSHGDWQLFLDETVVATERLIDAAVEAGVGRFVHVSSLGIFEIASDGVTITEDSEYDHQPMLRGYYTRSKIDADRIARRAARIGQPVVIVRPGQIYGHDHPSEPLFLGRVNKRVRGRALVVSKPSYLAPIVYVENAADAVVLAGTRPGLEGRVFNVIDDSDLTQSRYFDEVAGRPGCPAAFFYLPVALFAPAVAAVDFLHRLLKRRPWAAAYQLRRSGLNARYATEPARAELGWEPRVGLRDAVVASTGGASP